MRWIFLVVFVVGFAIVFLAKTPGLMGLGLVLGLVSLFGALFGFAAARIASTAQPDAALLTDRDISVLRASIRKPGVTSPPNVSPSSRS